MSKEVVTCLMNIGTTCNGSKRKNVSMVMCDNHLRDCFGLEMEFTKHDLRTEVNMVGGFLQPAENVVFQRDTVIIPTRHFFDHTVRPQDTPESDAPKFKEDFYVMNPLVYELLRNLALELDKKGLGGGNSDKKSEDTAAQLKFMIEMYRNLAEQDIDTGPHESQKTQDRKMILLIQQKKSMSETEIKTQSIMNHVGDCSITMLKQNGETESISVNDMKISLIAKFLILNIMFATHTLRTAQEHSIKFVEHIMPNVQWVENVGLVALENIGKSNFLIMRGVREASRIFYNSVISAIMKKMMDQKVDHRDAISQFLISSELRDGISRCLPTSKMR